MGCASSKGSALNTTVVSVEENDDARRKRLSVTGGPIGAKTTTNEEDSRRRRLSVATQPKESAVAVQELNKSYSKLPVFESVIGTGPPGGMRAKHLPIIYGMYSRPGNDPMKDMKENQDAMVVHDTYGDVEDQMFLAVMDGHGPNGAFASHFVRDNLPRALIASNLDKGAKDAYPMACALTSRELRDSSIDVFVSGTTAVTAVLRNRHLTVGNVGDSRAVVGRFQNGTLKALDVSSDHKPERPDEKKRVLKSGGRVYTWGVPRVWLKDVDMPGLAMTRSFGDRAAESVGVYAEPEIMELDLTPEDSFIIFASDGVWEFISSQEAVDIVGKWRDKDPQKACDALVAESVRRWEDEEDVVDDTTCIIAFFNFSDQK